ncbi:hypothetical protein HN51_070175 [Arachis hypogaea]
MARWLPSLRSLYNYVEKFQSRAIVLPRAVYSTLNYIVPESDEEDEEVMSLIEFDLGLWYYKVTLEQLAEQYNLVYHGEKFTGGTKIFKWLGIDLSKEKSIVLGNVAKIDDSTLRQIERDPNAQEPQVQAQPQESPPPLPPSPTVRDLMDELQSMKLYIEGQFAEMKDRQDRQTEAINR